MKWSIIVCALAFGTIVGCEKKEEQTPTDPDASTPTASQPELPDGLNDLANTAGNALNDAVDAATSAAAAIKVNLNTGTREQFMALPEVNARMAHEFDEYRPYVSIQQFRKEIAKYVDDEQVTRFEQFVFVPIAANDCDAETLQQIPGLDADDAATLIAGRPYASNDAFLAALAEHVAADQVEIAKTYLTQ